MAEPLAIFNVKPPWYVDHVFCLNTPVHFPPSPSQDVGSEFTPYPDIYVHDLIHLEATIYFRGEPLLSYFSRRISPHFTIRL